MYKTRLTYHMVLRNIAISPLKIIEVENSGERKSRDVMEAEVKILESLKD